MAESGLHDEIRRVHAAGDVENLKRIAKTALDTDSDELRALVDVAIHLRYSASDLSEAVLRHIVRKDPKSPYGHYELAISCLLRGDHLEGARLLEHMLSFAPTDPRANVLHARFLCGIGAPDLALSRLQNARAHLNLEEGVILEQFAHFISELPLNKAIYLSAPRPLADAHAAKEKIKTALKEKHGFSLVRFGDGEGVFFKDSLERERAFSSLYRSVRADRARVWFGDQLDAVMPTFSKQALQISDVYDECDIAGVPYRSWIEHEYKILSYSGIVGLGNIARHVSFAAASPMLASQMIHIDLARSGALREILTNLDRCSIISCFPETQALLKESFGIREIEFLKVPGEKLFSDKIGQAAAAGSHFPETFEAIMQSLSQQHEGRLFLVAAGILGKFYCARIKRFGGVALDIGSLVDAALGKETRPGYSSARRLQW